MTTIVIGVTNQSTALDACSRGLALARATDAAVHLVYAVNEGDSKAEDVARRHAEGLLESISLSSSVPMTVHVVHSKPHDAILEVAQLTAADMIVVGNRGLVQHGRFTRQPPAQVLRGARCSVLEVDTDPADKL